MMRSAAFYITGAWVAFIMVFGGCAAPAYMMAPQGSLPRNLPAGDIRDSAFFPELERTYGTAAYESAKINYLLGNIALLDYQFVRNGYTFDASTTAQHLRKKYRKHVREVKTARILIDRIASNSSMSGKPYLALPGDGFSYETQDLLNYELARLESEMDRIMSER